LSFDFRHLLKVLRRDPDPFLVLKLFDLSLFVLPEPGFKFEKRH